MNSKHYKIIAIAAISFACASCAATKNSSVSKDAELAYSTGDYQKALQVCETTIESQKLAGKEANGAVYNLAGLAANELNNEEKSIAYLEKSKLLSGSNDRTYSVLAAIYLKKDNLSKEIGNLEGYKTLYPSGPDIVDVNNRLFSAYVRSENWELGDSLWLQLDSASCESKQNLTGYLAIKQKLGQQGESEAIATRLLKLDKNSVEALEYFADKYYDRADSTYVKEMKAYEKNQTMKQYKRLTAKLKDVNSDFKIARDYYEKLYRLNPQKRYAKNLGNIYTRFENKQKAKYYYKLAK